MTQRAKLRRLAFIDFPSWSRGSRPSVLWTLWTLSLGCHEGIPWSPSRNLGANSINAKGTRQDYLARPSLIPAKKLATESRVVAGGYGAAKRAPAGLEGHFCRERRAGAGVMRISPLPT